jgi:flagellar biosynthesis chaperone FliJ
LDFINKAVTFVNEKTDYTMTLKEINQKLENLRKILDLINLERVDFEQRIGKKRTQGLVDKTLDRIIYLKKLKAKIEENDIG